MLLIIFHSSWLPEVSIYYFCHPFFVLPHDFQSLQAGLSHCCSTCVWDGAFPSRGRLVPVPNPPRPSLILMGLIPRSAPEWIKHRSRAVLTTNFKFVFQIKSIVRKPFFIFSVKEPKGSPSDQHVCLTPAVHYWVGKLCYENLTKFRRSF